MSAPSVASSNPAAKPATERPHPEQPRRKLALASVGALGVVFGDIGTSPLYVMKECFSWHPGGTFPGGLPASPHAIAPTLANVLGVLSLTVWALILVVSVKYVTFVMRADNKGEGGILALSAFVEGDRPSSGARPSRIAIPILLGLFGAGLLFGDGVITPAISVLSATEGIATQDSALSHLAVPITIAIVVALFSVQRFGTGWIGFAFGPVMVIWFVAIGIVGLRWVIVEPFVLEAADPRHAVAFVASHGIKSFLLLALVFLVVTGGEALYADLGHFGRRPIRLAWFLVAMPALLLSYFGQGALLLAHPIGTIQNPFYAAAGTMVIPMVVLATMATVIASQALISGVFSLSRQAMLLEFLPRVTVVHTSARTEGQIYVPGINWVLMAGTIAVVLHFRTASGLAAAYGVAVVGTMAITTYLFYLACRRRWGYSQLAALAFLVPFLTIDLLFVAANSTKFVEGGWLPLTIGAGVFAIMTTWWSGRTALAKILRSGATLDHLLEDLAARALPRMPGTGVFLTSTPGGTPNVLLQYLRHNPVLHARVVLFSLQVLNVPRTDLAKGLLVSDLGHGVFRVIAKVGFMQRVDVPGLLRRCAAHDLVIEPGATTYYLGRQTLLTTGNSGLATWRKRLFAILARNARSPTEFFNLPPNRVFELGIQVAI